MSAISRAAFRQPPLSPIQTGRPVYAIKTGKFVYGIRHAEAWHNVLYTVFGETVFEEYPDTTLTANGMKQAATTKVPPVELVLVSPLLRTLQTANIMYPNTPQIALECLKEYPQKKHLSNKRSSASLLKRLFPKVDFNDLQSDEQPWPNLVSIDQNMQTAKDWIRNVPENRIAVITHSTWLRYYMTGKIQEFPELEHCKVYNLNT